MSIIISAAVTPFTDDDRLDLDSAERLYEFNLQRGVDGFFVFGNMGEWALLTPEEKDALAARACEVIGTRARILLGITDTGMPNILRNMERWRHLPHTAWTFLFPAGLYGPACPVKYVHRIADASDRPVYLYYAPCVNGVNVTTAEFRDILSHPRVAGVKNSAGTMRVRRELLLLKRTVDFELFEGEEWAIDEALMLGCDGAIAGFGSTAGKLIKRIATEMETGNLTAAQSSQARLIEIFHSVYGPEVRWACGGQKYALQYMGLIDSARSRVESQNAMPESHKAVIRACIDANREVLF